MKFKIVGIKKVSGVYNEKAYQHYSLYYQVLVPQDCIGVQVEKIKVSTLVVDKWLVDSKANDIKSLIGKEFEEILYNAYKNVIDIR